MPTKRRNFSEDVISLGSGSDDNDDDAEPVAGPSNSARRRLVRVPSTPARRRDARSAELDVPHALDDASRTRLHVAIATVPEERVREAFAALVDALPTVTERVFQMLVANRAEDGREEQQAGHSRSVECTKCGEEYDTGTPRQPRECRYHKGRLEVNYAAFVDWDEDVHGEMDTAQNREEYPENFRWTCCRRDGTRAGCVHGEHEPDKGQSGRKRARRH
ncbi:hypothetical protein FKP32DRAFT_960351 [Trametes sanguinea]|nr:hypothetical protein FKP32DRAFT_960351 [Trametes sanguinea]